MNFNSVFSDNLYVIQNGQLGQHRGQERRFPNGQTLHYLPSQSGQSVEFTSSQSGLGQVVHQPSTEDPKPDYSQNPPSYHEL